MSDPPLHGQVAVVAGATRGAGRGIARMLGAAGATVYCTGRSVRGSPATAGRPETIEETAEMVTAEAAGASPSGRTTRRSRKSNGCSSASAPKRAGWTCWSTTSGAATR